MRRKVAGEQRKMHLNMPLAAGPRRVNIVMDDIAFLGLDLGEEVHLSNCITSERGYFYLARDLNQTEAQPEGTEILQLRRLPFAEADMTTDATYDNATLTSYRNHP